MLHVKIILHDHLEDVHIYCKIHVSLCIPVVNDNE